MLLDILKYRSINTRSRNEATNEECCVCYTNLAKVGKIILNCNHYMCPSCSTKLRVCPLCREPIRNTKIRYVGDDRKCALFMPPFNIDDPKITSLNLSNIKLTHSNIKVFMNELSKGALPKLTSLSLSHNKIGDSGVIAFATALGSGALVGVHEGFTCEVSGMMPILGSRYHLKGEDYDLCEDEFDQLDVEEKQKYEKIAPTVFARRALAQLTTLYLDDLQIGDEGMRSLSDAIGSGALPNLRRLSLSTNNIGDEGMRSLLDAIGNGALASLTTLEIGGNKIGNDGMKSLATAIGSGALDKLTYLAIVWNPNATETGKQAMRDAAKARGLNVSI